MTDYLTTREVAARLKLSKATVLRKVGRGEIPAFRLGANQLRFSEEEVFGTYLESTRTTTRPESRLAPVPDPDDGRS